MATGSSRKATLAAIVLCAGSGVTLAGLTAVRPHVAGTPSAWRGDDLALVAGWLVAVTSATWLALTTLTCLAALARGDHRLAARLGALAPPIARGILGAAMVSTWALVPTAARAGPAPPVALQVGSDGRLGAQPASGPSPSDLVAEVPVVRTPASNPPTSVAPSRPRPLARHAHVARAARASTNTYVVRAGDNLWRIARAEVTRTTGGTAPDEAVARYWRRVVAANRTTLRSGDPSLIFPGEVVTLPAD